MLNIVGKGMGGGPIEQDMTDSGCVGHGRSGAKKYAGTVVGDQECALHGGPEWTSASSEQWKPGTQANIPVMVDSARFRRSGRTRIWS